MWFNKRKIILIHDKCKVFQIVLDMIFVIAIKWVTNALILIIVKKNALVLITTLTEKRQDYWLKLLLTRIWAQVW